MSIVDGNIGTFDYPNTNMTAWLCSSVVNGGGSMNNSSPEAQLFFENFTLTSQFQGLTINGVSMCGNSEMVGPGVPPSFYIGKVYDLNGDTVSVGWQAVEYDMTQDLQNSCFSHHTN